MDDADSISSRTHVAGENASILTMAASLADADALSPADIVGVVGNSMGWYTALAVAGALALPHALQLVETMAEYQQDNVIGGQLLYPLVDDEWRTFPSPELDSALADTPELYHSIHLGGQAVVGGSLPALASLAGRLPPRKVGTRDAPMQLPLHSAFHTPLMAGTSARAVAELGHLPFWAPRVPLVDGLGRIHHPISGDPVRLREYTLVDQVIAPYDFSRSVLVALRELAPDRIVLLGPGGNLGGAVAQILIREGWRGLHSRSDFIAQQAGDPFVVAMNRPEQRALVTRD
jgi:malonyl CoA-acyl carrier protein transacylase